MKHSKIIVLFLFGCSICCNAQKNNFHYKRKVNGITGEGWYSVKLPPEIFKGTTTDLKDLRLYSVVNNDTNEIPYLIKKRITQIKRKDVELAVLNKSKKAGVLYLMFELTKGQKVNFIDLEFEERNFFGSVNIEGSNDKKEWFEIVNNDRIFSINNPSANYEYGEVNFPLTDYQYLRVSIKSDRPLNFKRASFRNEEINKGTFEDIKLRWNTHEEKDTKRSVVDIKLDHYRPVSDISIEVNNDKDYYRYCQIEYLSDSSQTPKGWIRNYEIDNEGYLTSFKPNDFTFDNPIAKELRIVINNLDNPPLEIKNIKVAGPVVELIANLKPGEIFLAYGNPDSHAPSYDLAYFEEKIPVNLKSVSLDKEEDISTPKEKVNALFENKLWLWGILGAIIAVLAFFTLRMMKST